VNNEVRIPVRRFPLYVADERTGKAEYDSIVLTKDQLNACQIVGQSSRELIYRLYNRLGYRVLFVGKPVKKEIIVDLYSLKGRIIAEGDVLYDPSAEEGDSE